MTMDCQKTSPAKRLGQFLADERGATAIEYGLIVALLSVAVLVAINSTGSGLQSTYTTIKTALAAMI
jgi:pilus assembly protein Flp/PilA